MTENSKKMKEKGISSIVGIGVTVVILMIAGSLFVSSVRSYQTETRSAERKRDKKITKTTETDVKLENALYNSTNDNIMIKAKNTGSTVLEVPGVHILLNGKIITDEKISSELINRTDSDIWYPTENLTVRIENQTEKPDMVKIVVEYGVSDYLAQIGDA